MKAASSLPIGTPMISESPLSVVSDILGLASELIPR